MKILLIANSKYVLTNFRGELIEELNSKHHQVLLVCPLGKDIDGGYVNEGVIPIYLSRSGLNPMKDFVSFISISKIMLREKPDIVLNFTIKPVIFASMAAFLFSKASIYSNITGLGYVFTGENFKTKILKLIVVNLYKVALGVNQKVFFQNPDDINLFLDESIIDKKRVKLLNGSGINLIKFKPNQNSKKERSSFLFVGRLLKDKGINELVSAVNLVRNEVKEFIVYIVGEPDNNPSSVSSEEISKLKNIPNIKFVGRLDDVRPYFEKCEVFILPSYREGTPRAVLEAMASGLPIITTDVPGCRETVKDGINGFLVPVRSSGAIAKKMLFFINNSEKVKEMGIESLSYAKTKFDVEAVNKEILTTIGL